MYAEEPNGLREDIHVLVGSEPTVKLSKKTTEKCVAECTKKNLDSTVYCHYFVRHDGRTITTAAAAAAAVVVKVVIVVVAEIAAAVVVVAVMMVMLVEVVVTAATVVIVNVAAVVEVVVLISLY